jgi:hypothetical protein
MGAGCWELGVGYWILGIGYWVLGTGPLSFVRIVRPEKRTAEYRISNIECRRVESFRSIFFYKWIEYIHSSIVNRHSSLVLATGYWVLGIGHWILDA